MSKRILLTAIGCFAVSTITGPAVAGTKDDVRDLQARMERLEQAAPAQSAATVRISELEREIQELTGRIEELSFKLEQSNRRLDSISAVLAGDLPAGSGDNVAVIGDAIGAAAGTVNGAAVSGPVDLTSAGDPIADQLRSQSASEIGGQAPKVVLPADAEAAFEYASGYLLAGDYARAKSAFSLYVQTFPNHPRAADARFRLGEIHLALSENAAAADIFIGHIRTYPSDRRAAEAYLKLGTAFARMDKPAEACKVLKAMKSKFPNAAGPVRQRADLEMARINCQ